MNLLEIITQLMPPEQDVALEAFIGERTNLFKALLVLHPVKNRRSSICNSDAFWLYWLVSAIKPAVAIESGSHFGFSTYFIFKAGTPDMQFFSFDPNHATIPFGFLHQHLKSDWSERLPAMTEICRDKVALAFFDDHIDHELRLRQAAEAGIKHLIFHDNYLTLRHSHTPIRFVNLMGLVDFCFEFPPLLAHHDPIFAGSMRRWLTYVRLKTPCGEKGTPLK